MPHGIHFRPPSLMRIMKKNWLLYKKLHRWPGLVISFFLLYFGITGIFLNHRETFSHIDIGRKHLPESYHYINWNNAALKEALNISGDSILIYGAVGIWMTDSTYTDYHCFNTGLPVGSDNRRIFDLHRAEDGHLYAATQFGLYAFDKNSKLWIRFNIDEDIKRFVGIENIGDTIYALSRSYLYKGKSEGINTNFEKIELKAPADFQQRVSLMKTIWQIHSGEIFGLPGQLFVDLLGLLTIFLSLTGIVWFFFPDWIKRRRKKDKPRQTIKKISTWSLRWHNKIGEWSFVFLTILYFSGIFLRPPLLIAIAYTDVPPIKHTYLDQPNPWYDKLRDLLYDEEKNMLLVSTLDGMFYMNTDDYTLNKFEIQPPISVMGITVFEPYQDGAYLIGSFSGLFLWHPSKTEIINYVTAEPYQDKTGGRPTGDYKVTGAINYGHNKRYMIDYDAGALPQGHHSAFPQMTNDIVDNSGLSLWNVALEIHTGRFFSVIFGDFYILIVPLAGLGATTVVISGYILYRRKYKRKKC